MAAPLLGVWVASTSPGLSSWLVIAIAIVVLSPLVLRMLEGRFDPFEPLVVFALAYGVMFAARPAVMIARNDYTFIFEPSLDIRQTFDEMLLLALLGAIAFVVGYGLPAGRRLAQAAPRAIRDFDPQITVSVSLAIAAVGVLSFLLFVAQGGALSLAEILRGRTLELSQLIQTTPKYLFYGSMLLIGPAVLLFALSRERKGPVIALLALGVILLAIVIRGSFGSRIALLPLFGAIIVYWYLSRDRRPHIATLITLAVLALIASSAIFHGRNPAPGQSAPASYAGGLKITLTEPGAVLDPVVKEHDAAMAPDLAAAMRVIPEQIEHEYGLSALTDLASRGVPRDVWNGKPRPPHEEVTRAVAPRPTPSPPYAISYSALLQGYLDWGMFGAIWLIAYGILARMLFEWYRLNRESTEARVVLALGLPLLVPALRDGPVDTLFLVTAVLAPVLLAFRLAHRVRAGGAVAPAAG